MYLFFTQLVYDCMHSRQWENTFMIREIKAIAADIDMTLTAKGGDLPEATVTAFKILHEHGVKIGLATGRVIEEREKNFGTAWGLGFDFDFVIGMNGGMVYDRATDRMWETELLTTEEMRETLEYMMPIIDRYHIPVNCEGGGNINAMNIQGELLEAELRHGWRFEDHTGDLDGFCAKRCFKMLFRCEEHVDEVRDFFLQKYGDTYQMIETFPGTVEMMHKGIDKGNGMKIWTGWNGIDMADCVGFGDNENDNTLLMDCGLGVCLKDGNPKTKAVADVLTDCTCEEGGVGHFLIDHYLKPKGLME